MYHCRNLEKMVVGILLFLILLTSSQLCISNEDSFGVRELDNLGVLFLNLGGPEKQEVLLKTE